MSPIEQEHAQHIDELAQRIEVLESVVEGLSETVMFFINQQNLLMEERIKNVQTH